MPKQRVFENDILRTHTNRLRESVGQISKNNDLRDQLNLWEYICLIISFLTEVNFIVLYINQNKNLYINAL